MITLHLEVFNYHIKTIFLSIFLFSQAVDKDFWCEQPDHLKSIPLAIWRNLTQPKDGCQILDAPYTDLNYDNFTQYFENFNLSTTIECKKFEFDSELFGTTIRSEFDLICDQNTLMSTVEMCFLLGAALGSVCSGWISDQFGRRHTLMSFALIQAVIGELFMRCLSYKYEEFVYWLEGFLVKIVCRNLGSEGR